MSLKQTVKNVLTRNRLLKKVYDVYHSYAKYVYQIGKPKILLHTGTQLKTFDRGVQSFFGYYDKSPQRNGKYLYHVASSRSLSLNQTIDLYCDDRKIGETTSWNWQQGAMLGWLNDKEAIYNFFDGIDYRAKIVNVNDGCERTLSSAIYAVSSDSKFALTLDFRRLAKLRPDYGYFNLPYKDLVKLDPNDGIYRIDLETDSKELLINFEELANLSHRKSMENAAHKVNHMMISPNCERFMFLHRWYDPSNIKHTRLIVYRFHDRSLSILADEDMVSHCTWKNDREIVGYLRQDGRDGYYLIDVETKKITPFLSNELLADDGHPSFSKDERWMLTDRYPDFTCKSKLLLYDGKINKTTILGEFYSPRKYQGINRCDLHPRWNHADGQVTFDTVHQGIRRMCALNIEKILDEVRK